MSVLWNLKFANKKDVEKVRKEAKNFNVDVLGMGNLSAANKPIDENCLMLSAKTSEKILSFLGDIKVNAEVISRG